MNNNKEINNNAKESLKCKETQFTDECQEIEKKWNGLSRSAFQEQFTMERQRRTELQAKINDTNIETDQLPQSSLEDELAKNKKQSSKKLAIEKQVDVFQGKEELWREKQFMVTELERHLKASEKQLATVYQK